MKLRVLLGLSVIFVSLSTMAATRTYTGNGAGGSGIVSQGSLVLSGNVGGSISVTFTRGGSDMSTMQDYLVLFLDSRAGGFTSTAQFRDPSVPFVSGYNGSSSSTANFYPGFTADFALVIQPDLGARLYELSAGTVTRTDTIYAGPWSSQMNWVYSLNLPRGDIGLGGTDTLRFQSSYVGSAGSRTRESFESLTGSPGFNTIDFTGVSVFDVQPVPEMTNVAAMIFGGVVLGVGCVKRLRRGMRQKRR